MNAQEPGRHTLEDGINKSLALLWNLEHPLGSNAQCPTVHLTSDFKCGIYNGKFRQCIHRASEHHGLGKEEKDIFHRSDLH